jgi:hypothetical protein
MNNNSTLNDRNNTYCILNKFTHKSWYGTDWSIYIVSNTAMSVDSYIVYLTYALKSLHQYIMHTHTYGAQVQVM